MATRNYLIAVLSLAFISLFCLGCSVPLRSYIWNTSSMPRSITIHYIGNPEAAVQFYYTDIEQEPSYNLMKGFKTSIKAQQMASNIYEFEIPPKSLVFIEQSLNFRSLLYKSIKIGEIELIDSDGRYTKDFAIKREGLSKYSIWYKID